MNKNILFIVIASTIIACAQTNKTKKEHTMQTRPIEEIYSNRDSLTYASMPQYFVEANQSGCFYEIYVNGILVFKHYKNMGLANHAVAINDNILKSGSQTVTIKLFAMGKIGNKDYAVLNENTRFSLEIFKRDKQTPWEGLDYDIVHEYFAPTTTEKEAGPFKHNGLPMYEETFTFTAKVPYKLKGWSESQVLKGQKNIEQEVLDFYAEYADVIQNKNEKRWVEMVKEREQEYFESVYYNDISDEGLKKRIAAFVNTLDNEFLEKIPLDKYEMVFSPDGKIVTLKSLDYPGASAFSFAEKISENSKRKKVISSIYLFLHKPKGSNKLEIIR